jgi:hypothetical protein
MSRFALFAILLVACDASVPRTTQGTSIGDEGGERYCGDTEAPVELGESVPNFGETPGEMVDAVTGTFEGDSGTLAIDAAVEDVFHRDEEPLPWEGDSAEDVPPEPVCVDWVFAYTALDFDFPHGEIGDTRSRLSFADDGRWSAGTGVRIHEGPIEPDEFDDEEGDWEEDPGTWVPTAWATITAAPSSFVIEEMFAVDVELRAEWNGDGWDATVRWIAETYPEGEDANVRSIEEEIWSGTLRR